MGLPVQSHDHPAETLKLSRAPVDGTGVADLVADHPNPLGGLSPQRHLNRLLDRATFFEHLRRAMARNEGVGGNLALLAMAMDPFVVSDADASDAWGIREEILTVTAGRFLGCLHHTCVT